MSLNLTSTTYPDDVTLNVPQGNLTAVGPSGPGKSNLLAVPGATLTACRGTYIDPLTAPGEPR